MRRLIRPNPPEEADFDAQAATLVNEWGRFCSFCEKPLDYRLELFHRQRGHLEPGEVGADDWPHLFLACGDCINAARGTIPGNVPCLWPDEDRMAADPFVYGLVPMVPRQVLDAGGWVVMQDTVDLILVQVSSGVDEELEKAAASTLSLFRLNGHDFESDVSGPRVTVLGYEYLSGGDQRPLQRLAAYRDGLAAGRALVNAAEITSMPDYLRGVLELVLLTISTRGYHSTWKAAAELQLRQAGDKIYGAVLEAMEPTPEKMEEEQTVPPGESENLGDLEIRSGKLIHLLDNQWTIDPGKRAKLDATLNGLLPSDGDIDVGA